MKKVFVSGCHDMLHSGQQICQRLARQHRHCLAQPLKAYEVDFLVQYNGVVVPVEVKAEENLQAKSLKVYLDKFRPTVSVRTSMSDFRRQDWLANLPLYAISELRNLISSGDNQEG